MLKRENFAFFESENMLPSSTANVGLDHKRGKKCCSCFNDQFSKSIQRSFYSFATSKWGAILLIIITFITLNTALHLLQSILDISITDKTTLVVSL